MYFRCADCLSESWIDGDRVLRESDELSCSECGRDYVLKPVPDFGASVAAQYQATMALAQRRRVDPATSLSILLGVLSEQDLDHLGAANRAEEEPAEADLPAVSEAPRAGSKLVAALAEYDPAFTAAVTAGSLSVREAVRRGDREAYIGNLMSKYRFRREMAAAVADNRIALGRALAQLVANAPTEPAPHSGPRVSRFQVLVSAMVALTAISAAAVGVWRNSFAARPVPTTPVVAARPATPEAEIETKVAGESSPSPVARRVSLTAVERNDAGQMIEVRGPDPIAVLVAFCENRGGDLEPLEVTETKPQLGHARLGVFRDPERLQHSLAIWMRRDRRTGRWVAGDGRGEIPVREAPEMAPGAYRRNVPDS
ncbi:MAG: hypothetical protein GY716_03125 [bacterium]|nr:hypothetical protein [bacterium]